MAVQFTITTPQGVTAPVYARVAYITVTDGGARGAAYFDGYANEEARREGKEPFWFTEVPFDIDPDRLGLDRSLHPQAYDALKTGPVHGYEDQAPFADAADV